MFFDLKRIFLIFGLVLTLLLLTPSPTYALWPIEDIQDKMGELWDSVSCPTDLDCWVDQASTAAANYGFRVIVGKDVDKIAASTGEWFGDNGLLALMGVVGDQTYNYPPDIHLASYFRHELGDNLLSSPIHATVGTQMLDPIFHVWEQMRNFAYALFIVIVTAIALMIILRTQVASRVVVTVTHAIPKIFLSLILITLSYPIAALFVDVGIVWTSAVLVKLGLGEVPDFPGIGIPEEGLTKAFGNVSQTILMAALKIFLVPGEAFLTFILLIFVLLFLIGAVIIIGLIVLQLLYRYARIIVMTIFAPLFFLLGALPGQEGATTNWFKDLTVNTLTFPGILLMVYVSSTLLLTAVAEQVEHLTGGWPETLHELLPPFSPVVLGIVALIVLLMSFKIPGIIEEAIKGKH